MDLTTSWYCDICGTLIQTPEQGVIEWARAPGPRTLPSKGISLRIVHRCPRTGGQASCQYHADEIGGYWQLTDMAGVDGQIIMLEVLAQGRFPVGDWVELFKRLYIPGYERARFHFEDAVNAGILETSSDPGFYRLAEIQAVLTWVERNGREREQ